MGLGVLIEAFYCARSDFYPRTFLISVNTPIRTHLELATTDDEFGQFGHLLLL